MKTKLFISIFSMSVCALILNAQTFYRTGSSDTNWSTLENWTADEAGLTPVTTIPGKTANNYAYFYGASDGTTTVIDSSEGNLTFVGFYSKNSNSNLVFDGATVTASNRFQFNEAAGTAEANTTFNMSVTNGSNVKTWMFYGTKAAYTNTTLTIDGNSTFQITSTTWNHLQIVNAADTKATWNIEKGSSLITSTNLTVNGTHGSAARSEVYINVKGTLQSNGIFVGDGSNSKGTVNIYGSASYISTAALELKNTNSKLNIITQDVGADRISHVTEGVVDDYNDAILTFTKFGTQTGSINIDLENFYVDTDFSYINGETYAISLIAVDSLENVFSTDKVNILNGDKMGDKWQLASSDKSEYLKWDENNILQLYVTAVPEPSTYAMIFGALALAIAAYRRRK